MNRYREITPKGLVESDLTNKIIDLNQLNFGDVVVVEYKDGVLEACTVGMSLETKELGLVSLRNLHKNLPVLPVLIVKEGLLDEIIIYEAELNENIVITGHDILFAIILLLISILVPHSTYAFAKIVFRILALVLLIKSNIWRKLFM